ncbi:MAG: PHP domain-containing protein [Clostridia bacterium]|nr:PHP domain-containing protein [Clostridia bacterium]
MKYCDLHTHSIYSDGTFTPKEIIEAAEAIGLNAVALCDHNTVSGVPEFLESAKGKKVKAVAGIEISTDYGETELHIVGLFIDPESFDTVEAFVRPMVQRKEDSNRLVIEKLRAGGYDIDFNEIKSKTPDGKFNRAHIATELTAKGYTKSVNEAFSTLLAEDSVYYVANKRIPTFEAIEFLKSINAVAVIAHPFLDLNEEELEIFLPEAKKHGLDAMEVLYSTYDEETTRKASELAERFGLLKSGGSDFHGTRKKDISLGIGRGALAIPFSVCEELEKLVR